VRRSFVAEWYYGLPGTDGSKSSNFWRFVKDEHPILATLTADDRHPYVEEDAAAAATATATAAAATLDHRTALRVLRYYYYYYS